MLVQCRCGVLLWTALGIMLKQAVLPLAHAVDAMEDHLPYLSLERNVDAPLLKAWIPAAVASWAFLGWSTVPVLQALVAKRVTTVQRFRLQDSQRLSQATRR
jgi:hypothetical protein